MFYNKVEISGVNTSKLKVLRESEKMALLKKVKEGDMQAREELINGNLRLVLSVIQQFAGRGENADDLFQVGCIGLIKAIDNFDISQPVRFSTYAVPIVYVWRNVCWCGVSILTKREALHFVRQLVENQPSTSTTQKVLEQLEKIEEEVCRKSWTREKCLQALADWKEKTGRAPIVSNLGADDLPSKFVIERVFGEKASVVLRRYYPEGLSRIYCDRVYSSYSVEQLTEFIKEQIEILHPQSGQDYNIRRLAKSPVWETIAKRLGCRSWNQLYLKVMGGNAVPSDRRECKILHVEVKSQLADDLHTILADSKGE